MTRSPRKPLVRLTEMIGGAFDEIAGPESMNSMMMNRMQGRGMGMGRRQGNSMGVRRMMRMSGGELSFDESHNFLTMAETFGGTKDNLTKKIVVRISFQSLHERGSWKPVNGNIAMPVW